MSILGIVLLLISLLGGEIGDMDIELDVDVDVDFDGAGEADSASIFSMRTMSAGLVAFGVGAMIMLENGHTQGIQLLVGAITAGVVGYLSYLLTKFMYSFQGSSNVSLAGVVGKKGIITIGTTINGTSQLRVDTINGPKEFTCKEVNENKLKISDNVTISDKIGNLLLVEK